MLTPIYLYNTLHRRKEQFTPLNPPEVGVYSCGPTVYNYAHIGNLRAFIFADLLKRVLLYNGYKVTHVMNITDVGHLTDDADQGEDKIEKGAAREGKTAWEIAEYYTKIFEEDIAKLNIQKHTISPKVTDHIQEQIDLIKKLEEKGLTYATDDGIYFDTAKFPSYAKLAKLDLENLEKGSRISFNKQKKNASDFALWKFSPEGTKRAMEWESPWGKGFPGWHIECSAMSMKYLGETFDIHTGGIDHIPVHHTNEIAQSEGATGKPFVKFWLHNEFLIFGKGEKMSKSTGNFIGLKEVIAKGYHPLDYRFANLQTLYRKPMSFSWTMMDAAKEGRARLNQFTRRIYTLRGKNVQKSDEKYLVKKKEAFINAFNDDINAPEALGILFEMVKDINSQLANDTLAVSPASIWEWLIDADKLLGLNLEKIGQEAADLPEEVQALLTQRQLARDHKDFEKSDQLRKEISALGIIVEDTDHGQETHPA